MFGFEGLFGAGIVSRSQLGAIYFPESPGIRRALVDISTESVQLPRRDDRPRPGKATLSRLVNARVGIDEVR